MRCTEAHFALESVMHVNTPTHMSVTCTHTHTHTHTQYARTHSYVKACTHSHTCTNNPGVLDGVERRFGLWVPILKGTVSKKREKSKHFAAQSVVKIFVSWEVRGLGSLVRAPPLDPTLPDSEPQMQFPHSGAGQAD